MKEIKEGLGGGCRGRLRVEEGKAVEGFNKGRLGLWRAFLVEGRRGKKKK